MTAVEFFVAGAAAPPGSKRHVGGGRMIESSKALAPWRTQVAWEARAAMARPHHPERRNRDACRLRVAAHPSDPQILTTTYEEAGSRQATAGGRRRPDTGGLGIYKRWSYFCGCCWTRIRQIQERAAEIIAEVGDN